MWDIKFRLHLRSKHLILKRGAVKCTNIMRFLKFFIHVAKCLTDANLGQQGPVVQMVNSTE